MFVTRIVSDNGLKLSDKGFEIDIRLPWYRALPLSSVEIAEVRIDNQVVDPKSLSFNLNGKNFSLEELPNHYEEWWFVLDSAYLRAKAPVLQPGSEHEIAVTVGLRPPYLPGFYRLTEGKKRLRAS